MTATLAPDKLRAVRGALERADARHARRTGDDPAPPDYLDALARAVTPETGASPAADPDEVAELRAAVAAAEQDRARALSGLEDAQRLLAQRDGQIKSLLAEVEQHRENTAAVRHTLQARVDELRVDLANARKAAAEPVEHRHAYPITDTGAIEPCACGQPYPRDVLAQHLAAIEPDEPEVEPLAAALARVRVELADWGKR